MSAARARRRSSAALAASGAVLAGLAAWSGSYGLAAGIVALAAAAIAALVRPSRGELGPADGISAGGREDGPDLISASPDPVIALDVRLVVTAANEAARGAVPGLRVGHPLAFALRAPEVLDAVRTALDTGRPGEAEYGGRTPGAPTFGVRVRPLGEAEGTSRAALLFFHDLSAERRLEAMRSDFVATVSHELRTPLASLSGFIDTLRGPARDDPAARERFLGVMRVQADRMTRLVDDLLQLSRVELNTHVAPQTIVDLVPLVGHMLEIMAPLARDRGVAIEAGLGDGERPILGERDELLRLVENLVENAVKYGGSGGRVEVGLNCDEGGWTVLSVRDHGPGVAAEHLPRLTERFYRADPVESRSQCGTGLGLAIVKHIVGHHRGRLAIESEPGRGVLVRVSFPPANAPPGAVTQVSSDRHRYGADER